MPLTPTATRIAPSAVRYEWAGTAPFDVWLDGRKVMDQTSLTQYIAQTTDGTTNPLPAVEVHDATDTGTPQNQKYSPRVRIQWRGQADASIYLIQEYADAQWNTRTTALEDGRGYYSVETPRQADGDTIEWRVVPQDSGGYQGAPMEFTMMVVCNPYPPAVTYTYDSGTGLTVGAA